MPSKLEILRRLALSQKGAYGAQRVERAADEIKNLTKLYSPSALESAFLGDNAKALMTMNPKDFERYAISLENTGNDIDYDNIKKLRNIRGGFSDVPFLEINKERQGLPTFPFISGHEGRHRNRAMAASGEQAGLVRLEPRAELREPFPRRTQEEYIEALRQELGMTGNKVIPEADYERKKREEYMESLRQRSGMTGDKVIPQGNYEGIDLPPIYKQGGAVSQDAMRLAVMNKKVQKKSGGGALKTAKELWDIAKGTRSKAAQIQAGLYHPIGGGVKLNTPVPLMEEKTISNPKSPLIPRKIITPEDMVGGVALPFVGDRAAAGRILTEIGGKKLSYPVELQGGPDYMRTHTFPRSPEESSIWASGKGVIKNLSNRSKFAREIAEREMGGKFTGDVYGVYSAMSPTGVDYNTMLTEALLGQIDTSTMSRSAINAFDSVMRKTNKNWAGLEHPAIQEQLLGQDKSAGKARKAFVKNMGMADFQGLGFPDVAAARKAITEPSLLDVPVGSSGYNIGKINVDAPITAEQTLPHWTYPTQMGGEYFGSLDQPVPFRDMWREFTELRRIGKDPEKSDWRSLGMSVPLQKLDQEWLDSIMKAQGKDLPSVGEYKDGGVVHMKDGKLVDELINEAKKRQQPPVDPLASKRSSKPSFSQYFDNQKSIESMRAEVEANRRAADAFTGADRIPEATVRSTEPAYKTPRERYITPNIEGSLIAAGMNPNLSRRETEQINSGVDWVPGAMLFEDARNVGDAVREGRYLDAYGNSLIGAANLVGAGAGVKKVLSPIVKPLANEAAYRINQAVMNGEGILAAPLSGIAPRRIFIGEKSAFYDNGGERAAKAMEAAGKTPEDIWMQTKTFKGADGKWRQEISDKDAKFFDAAAIRGKADAAKEFELAIKQKIEDSKAHPDLFPKQLTQAQKELRGQAKASKASREDYHGLQADPEYRGNYLDIALEHPTLYEAYPELRKVVVNQGGYGGDTLGQLTHAGGDFAMDIFDAGLKKDPRSTALHEAQHAIQSIEGWSPGGSSLMAFQNKEAFDILNDMRAKAKIPLPFDVYAKDGGWDNPQSAQRDYERYVKGLKTISPANDRVLQGEAAKMYYKRLAGETEARAVQDRMDFTDAQLAERPPSTDYEFQIDDQIVKPPFKMAGGGPASLDAMRLALQNKQVQHKAGGGKMEFLSAVGRGLKGMREPVKPKSITKEGGGNWLAGSVEGAMKPLKRGQMSSEDMALAEKLSQGTWNPELAATQKRRIEESTRNAPLNQFIDKQLTRYVKNQMATKEDPIRALAEKGTLHVNPEQLNFNPESYGKYLGAGQKVVAQSPTAKSWEGVTDLQTTPMTAGSLTGNTDEWGKAGENIVENNPWLTKVPNETSVYNITDPRGLSGDLGFDHLIDELRNATNPASGLPRELLLKPESLSKLSVPQAVERVAKINEWRAAQKAEADIVRARNPATFLHKEYPEGYSWYELKQPKDLPIGFSVVENKTTETFQVVGPDGKPLSRMEFDTPDEAKSFAMNSNDIDKSLDDALKYEGEQMGHCVGGYCPDVASGSSRIFSLRDAKGQPHVTIEETPHQGWFVKADAMPDPSGKHRSFHELIDNERGYLAQQKGGYGEIGESYEDTANRLANQYQLEAKPAIAQIKGKGNKAPNAEYLPFVQDFVKSGKWSDVGDFSNTGLMRIAPESNEALYLQKQNKPIPEYVSDQEYEEIRRGMAEAMRSPYGAADDMKEGGVAHLGVGGFLKKLLPAAEREANLQKFRELSKAPMRLYHGTTATEGGKGQEAIRILKPSKEGALGSGAYLTPKPNFAGEYSFPKDISDAARASIQSGIDNGEIFRRGSGNILPVFAQLKNPLILEGIKPPGAMYSGDPMVEALKKLGMDEDKASNMVEKAYENRGYIGKQVQSRAQAQGYDGIMQYRDGELMEVLPFSSNQVKSAIGNEGTYDIYSPELSKAKGGSVSMDAMRLAVMNKQLRKHHG